MNQPRPENETLNFKITIKGTYWGKQPQYAILIDNEEKARGTITVPSDTPILIEFDHTLSLNTEHSISVRFLNKTDAETVQNEDRTAIIKDMLLHVEKIEIDDIELEYLKFSQSKFVGDDPKRPILDNCLTMGWNGAYILKFTTPFYLWLLENM